MVLIWYHHQPCCLTQKSSLKLFSPSPSTHHHRSTDSKSHSLLSNSTSFVILIQAILISSVLLLQSLNFPTSTLTASPFQYTSLQYQFCLLELSKLCLIWLLNDILNSKIVTPLYSQLSILSSFYLLINLFQGHTLPYSPSKPWTHKLNIMHEYK